MEDSLKKRYIIKLLANILNGLINIILVAIVPKALGPIAYGNFTFIQQFFAQILAFLDGGTSIAFFTKLSAKHDRKELIIFYFFFSILVLGLLYLCIYLLEIFNYTSFFLPNIDNKYIYVGLWFGFLTWISHIFIKISDAFALTVSVEIIKITHKIITLFLLVLTISYLVFDLTTYFYFHLFSLISFMLILSFLFFKKDIFSYELLVLNIPFLKLSKEFFHYSSPLFIFNAISISVALFDIWLLQKISGSIQTGFYGLSYSIAAMCFLFTSAMTPLIMREFSKYYATSNILEIKKLFKRYIPMLYSISAYFGIFIAFQSENLLMIFTDEEFKGAIFVLMIMAFYPIHQTYGQLTSSLFFAFEETKLYRNIGVFFSFIGLIFTFIFLFYLELGAVGFAWKMVLIQILSVNVQLYFNVQQLDLRLSYFIKHQILSIVFFSLLAYISTIISYMFTNELISFLFSGVIYTVLVIVLSFFIPYIFGISKLDIINLIKRKNEN